MATGKKASKGSPKKPKLKAAAAAAGAAPPAPPTRCDQGEEILVNVITVAREQQVRLRLTLCKAAFRVIVHLDAQRIAEADPAVDEMVVDIGALTPGLHGLSWSYLTNAAQWKVLSEVGVDGTVRFRQRKGDDSGIPFNHSFVILQVP